LGNDAAKDVGINNHNDVDIHSSCTGESGSETITLIIIQSYSGSNFCHCLAASFRSLADEIIGYGANLASSASTDQHAHQIDGDG
jgi:hypothetical protein